MKSYAELRDAAVTSAKKLYDKLGNWRLVAESLSEEAIYNTERFAYQDHLRPGDPRAAFPGGNPVGFRLIRVPWTFRHTEDGAMDGAIILNSRGHTVARVSTPALAQLICNVVNRDAAVSGGVIYDKVECLKHGTKYGYCEECAFPMDEYPGRIAD